MDQRTSYIFLRKLHFLPLVFPLLGHYEAQGHSVHVVARPNLHPYLEEYGFFDPLQVITHRQLAAILPASTATPNLVLPHTPASLQDWNMVKGSAEPAPGVTMSFFADGYTNLLIGPGPIREFLIANPQCRPGDLLFFDSEGSMPAYHAGAFSRQIVSPAPLRRMASLSKLKAMAVEAGARIRERAAGKPIFLILLRPWGSQSYYKDRHVFEDVARKFDGVIEALVAEATTKFGRKPFSILRPDLRDPDLMAQIMLRQQNKPDNEFLDLNDLWPVEVNMDPFMLQLREMFPDQPVGIASLDSTATLPFIGLGLDVAYFLGAPRDAILPIYGQGAAAAELKSKMDLLERHIAGLSHRLPLEIQRADDFFVEVRLDRGGA